MIIPVRCFSCGTVIADAWEEYKERTDAGENPQQVLEDVGLERYCCRRMLLSHRETIDEVRQYSI
ncbi:DNA-directed RNA polymerase subunit N [Thermoplasmatales archaeon SW_10_69_26]|jgi:DNA-directed RNA polymerase subunit N|nr:MAG: DNA-directed RNA polymerase subunit N [Thermoplasmatales archaeon SW_10_69_26]